MKRNCRILALVLALVMTVSLFAACGGSEDPATTTTAATTTAATTTAATTTAATTTEATTTEATTTEATTTEPALNLAGYEFSIADGGDFLYGTISEFCTLHGRKRQLQDRYRRNFG